MRTERRLAAWLAVLALTSSCQLLTSCPSSICVPIVTLRVSVTPSMITGSGQQYLTVCRDQDDCAGARMPEAPPVGASTTISFSGEPNVDGVLVRQTQESLELTITWASAKGDRPPDGERYVVGLTDGSAAPVVLIDGTVTYRDTSEGACWGPCWRAGIGG